MKITLDRLSRWIRFNWMYFGAPPWDTGITPPELEEFIREHRPGRAIDLGCGTGTNLMALGRAGWQVTGVDFAVKATRMARRKLGKARIPADIRTGDVTRLATVQGKYDLVLDIGCYHGISLAGRLAYQANLRAILVSGGWYLLYAHLRMGEKPHGIGISQEDLSAFQKVLHIEKRQDSQDRWGRQAAWIWFRKQG